MYLNLFRLRLKYEMYFIVDNINKLLWLKSFRIDVLAK